MGLNGFERVCIRVGGFGWIWELWMNLRMNSREWMHWDAWMGVDEWIYLEEWSRVGHWGISNRWLPLNEYMAWGMNGPEWINAWIWSNERTNAWIWTGAWISRAGWISMNGRFGMYGSTEWTWNPDGTIPVDGHFGPHWNSPGPQLNRDPIEYLECEFRARAGNGGPRPGSSTMTHQARNYRHAVWTLKPSRISNIFLGHIL